MGSWISQEQNVENTAPQPPPQPPQPQRPQEGLQELQRWLHAVDSLQRLLELRLRDIDVDVDVNLRQRLQQLQETQQHQNPDTKEKCYDPNDPDLKFSEKDDEHDFLCEGYSSKRALMSCGHTVTPPSLFYWCLIQLNQGNTSFKCGVCKAVWPFEEVRKMALLTEEENDVFDDALFRNVAHKNLKIQNCPGCKSRVMRQDLNNLRVQCPQCTIKNGRMYEFCWQCRKKWKGLSRCGNEGCKNPHLTILKTCPEIEFEQVQGVKGCPSIRACPTCGKLLEHNREQCKNIRCPDCEVEFCFVCLKDTKECQNTSSYFKPCSSGVAPRQTSIPVKMN